MRGRRPGTKTWVCAVAAIAAACGPNGRAGDDDQRPIDAAPAVDAWQPPPIPIDCLVTAEHGLAWLAAQQNDDGSWGTGTFEVGTTAMAVLKLETYALETGRSPFDPAFAYAPQVARGFAYLLRRPYWTSLRAQSAGDPDVSGNGHGIRFTNVMYEDAIILMALVAGGDPDQHVASPGSLVDGWSFGSVAREMVDYFAFAQSDGVPPTGADCSRGGWRYQAFDQAPGGDNSVTQFVTLALEYARNGAYHFELEVPPWVTTELGRWTTCIQDRSGGADDGGAGYLRAEAPSSYTTAALVQELAFIGDGPESPAARAALGYLRRHWGDLTGAGWHEADGDTSYLAMYTIMKAMEAMAVDDLDGIDWYREMCDHLKATQNPNGSWPRGTLETERDVDGGALNATEWALLVLEKAAPPPGID